jgi:hypothetical protein
MTSSRLAQTLRNTMFYVVVLCSLIAIHVNACVMTDTQFIAAINQSPNRSHTMTRIDLCVSTINLNALGKFKKGQTPQHFYHHGIAVVNKNLDIRCNCTVSYCTLNAQGLSRHLYISNSTVIIRNVIFQNGRTTQVAPTHPMNSNGAALALTQSMVTLERCIFRQNTAHYAGGAIIAQNRTTLLMHNTTFQSNKAARVSFI